MNFGDYTFAGTYKLSKTAKQKALELKSSISFFMISLGYNLDLFAER